MPDAPYRGIEPFRFIDQLLFAARDDETWELLSKVTLYRAMLLYGESGAGKSSLINAGLLPEALNDNYISNRLRVQPFVDREIRVERVIKQDGPSPTYLRSTFRPINTPNKDSASDSASFELSLDTFLQQLSDVQSRPEPRAREPEDFGDGLIYESTACRPLLIFDQFEEFITLFEGGQRSQQSPSSREELGRLQQRILDVLVTLIRDTNLPLKMVFVFREDFLAKLNLLFEYCPELVDQAVRLVPPHVSALPKIIRQPFVNEELCSHFKATGQSGSELTEEISNEIAADLRERSDNHLINLSELQIVCLLLWRSPEPERLYREKRAKGLLEDYAASVVGQFSPELQDKAVALLAEMLTGSNTRNIVSEADLKMTGKAELMTEPEVDAMLDKLCQNQIVRRERHRELYFYELASEYLVSWINERATQREVDRLMKEAIEERRRAVQVQRFSRKILLLQTLVVALAIGILAVTIYLVNRSGKAEKERALAAQQAAESETRRFVAEGRARLAEEQRRRLEATITPLISSKDDAAKLEAISNIRKWTQERNLPSEFLLLLLAAQRQSENPAIKEAAREAITEAAKADPDFLRSIDLAVETDPNLAAKLPLRFNIYIADESQRGTAEKISNVLRQRGYVVASNPSVVSNPPKWDSELRYFTQPESGQKQPADLINLLKNLSRTNWRAAYNPRYSSSPRGSSGQIELWFAVPAGRLDIAFVDDTGKPVIGLKPTVRFVLTSGPGISFISRNLSITVPQGNYEVTIIVQDYKSIQQSLSIKGGDGVEWKDIKLTREQRTVSR
jgi:hypothetical protein